MNSTIVRYIAVILGVAIAAFIAQRQMKAQSCVVHDGVVTVASCGAVGNGVTDDTNAIKAAVAAIEGGQVPQLGVGGVVKFGTGIYLVSDTIMTKSQNITFQGNGPKASYLRTTAGFGAKPVIFFSGDTTINVVTFPAVKSLGIELNHVSSTGIRAVLTRNLTVSDVFIGNCTERPEVPNPCQWSNTATAVGIEVDGVDDTHYAAFTTIERSYISGVKYGIYLTNQVTRTWIKQNSLVGGSINDNAALYITSNVVNGVTVDANEIEGWVDGYRGEGANLTFIGNDFESNSAHHLNFVDNRPENPNPNEFYVYLLGNHYFGAPAGGMIGFPKGRLENHAGNLINIIDVANHFDAPGMNIKARYITATQTMMMQGRAINWGPANSGYEPGYRMLRGPE